MDWRFVVVMIDKPPLLDRIEPGSDQWYVGKCTALEGVDKSFRFVIACEIVEETSSDLDLTLDIGSLVGKLDEGRIGVERLSLGELGGPAWTLRRHRPCQ